MQWSRRFIGLKVFLSLAVAGWEGYEQSIRHQTAMGDFLVIVNRSVCFVEKWLLCRDQFFIQSTSEVGEKR